MVAEHAKQPGFIRRDQAVIGPGGFENDAVGVVMMPTLRVVLLLVEEIERFGALDQVLFELDHFFVEPVFVDAVRLFLQQNAEDDALELPAVEVRVGRVERGQDAAAVGELARVFLDDVGQVVVFKAADRFEVAAEDAQLHGLEHVGRDIGDALAECATATQA